MVEKNTSAHTKFLNFHFFRGHSTSNTSGDARGICISAPKCGEPQDRLYSLGRAVIEEGN